MAEFKRIILMAILWNYVLSLFGWLNVFAQNQDCYYRYSVGYGQQEILQSPGFDQGMYYYPGTVCRWSYSSPSGTVFDVSCNPIDIPKTEGCQQDRLAISLTGDPYLSDGQNFCGAGSVHLTSKSNALTIGLISATYSNGGRFRCVITAIYGGNIPPPVTTTTTKKPPPITCDCGARQQRRIVGGTETKINEYTFMAAIISLDKRKVWCGASIISNRHSLTAAHCLYQQTLTQYGLLVGDHNIEMPDETGSAALYLLYDFIPHEYYNSRTKANDIAIVQTEKQIVFSLNVAPICLPYRYTDLDFTGAPVTAMGWGTLFFTGPTSDSLQAVNLTIVSNAQCQAGYDHEVIYNSEVCTYAKNRDACSFDSGGPVVWFDTFNTYRYQLIGIISYGRDCGTSTPSVNTRVPSYISWILNETPDTEYCFL